MTNKVFYNFPTKEDYKIYKFNGANFEEYDFIPASSITLGKATIIPKAESISMVWPEDGELLVFVPAG